MFATFMGSPEESYSRRLDDEVSRSEMPYGYDNMPEPIMHEKSETSEYERAEEEGLRSRRRK